MGDFEIGRALLRGPDLFRRLRLDHEPVPLPSLGLEGATELLVFERGTSRFGLIALEMAYHHVAEGVVNGEPTMVSFCSVCHSAMGFDPRCEGRTLHFSAGGLYDGVVILIDDETRSYWNHITGECLHGTVRGARLRPLSIDHTRAGVEAARRDPCSVYPGRPTWVGRLMAFQQRRGVTEPAGSMPFFFRYSMAAVDPRAEKMEQGLGVMIDDAAKFYPLSELREPVDDPWQGGVRVERRTSDGVPVATRPSGAPLVQIFCRWYGFSSSYPTCEIFRRPTPA